MVDTNGDMKLSFEACLELHAKAQEVLNIFLIDKPVTKFRLAPDEPKTHVSFDCDVDVFEQFTTAVHTALGEGCINVNDKRVEKMFSAICDVSRRLSPSGQTMIDTSEAYAIQQLTGSLMDRGQDGFCLT